MEDREQQAQVAGDRGLEREQRLDRGLDPEEEPVDLVVEGDHLIGELGVALLERPHRAVNGGDGALALLLELRFDLAQFLVDRHRDTVSLLWCGFRGWFTTS